MCGNNKRGFLALATEIAHLRAFVLRLNAMTLSVPARAARGTRTAGRSPESSK